MHPQCATTRYLGHDAAALVVVARHRDDHSQRFKDSTTLLRRRIYGTLGKLTADGFQLFSLGWCRLLRQRFTGVKACLFETQALLLGFHLFELPC
jgi:hypothetical protein